jgi:hypothetical protein
MNRHGNEEKNKNPAMNRIPSGDGREPIIGVTVQVRARRDVVENCTGLAIKPEIEEAEDLSVEIRWLFSSETIPAINMRIGSPSRNQGWAQREKTHGR